MNATFAARASEVKSAVFITGLLGVESRWRVPTRIQAYCASSSRATSTPDRHVFSTPARLASLLPSQRLHQPNCGGDDTEGLALPTVLLDLDGVVRHFDPTHVASVEHRHGLSPGSLVTAVFELALLDRAITGAIRRSEWVAEVGARVGHADAAAEWMAEKGAVDEAMLSEVEGLRSRGVLVAVLANGTDTIPSEMEELGLSSRFDAIYNSAELGVAKPDRRVFEQVCSRLDVDPTEVFFTDDSSSKLRGAIEIGMTARLFEGIDQFRKHMVDAGLSPD